MTWTGIGDAADALEGADIRTNGSSTHVAAVAGPPHALPQHRPTSRSGHPRGMIDALPRIAWRPAEAGGITR